MDAALLLQLYLQLQSFRGFYVTAIGGIEGIAVSPKVYCHFDRFGRFDHFDHFDRFGRFDSFAHFVLRNTI